MTLLWKANKSIKIFVIVCLLAGCMKSNIASPEGESLSLNEENEAVSYNKDITIRYAQWSAPLTSAVEQVFYEYNNYNSDNIKVDLIKIPRARYNDIINMLLSSREGPDVFEARREWLFSYIYKNWIYDLTDFIDASFLEVFPEWAKDFANDPNFRSRFYSIPSVQTTFRLIFNKDLFMRAGLNPEKPPETFDDLRIYAKEITDAGKGDRKYGFALAAYDVWSGFIRPMEAMNAFSGVYFFDFRQGEYNLNVYQPWFHTLLCMKEDGSIFPGETTMKEDLALAQFADGNIGMMLAENWKPVLFESLYPAKCNWGVAMPPAIDKDRIGKGASAVDISGWYVVYSKTETPEKAILLWKYLYSQEYNRELYKKGCLLPIVNDIMDNPEYKPDIQNFDRFMLNSRDSVYPSTPLDIDESNRANVYISIYNESTPIDKGLSDETYLLNMLLDKGIIANRINVDNYTNTDFDPLNPINR